MRERYRFFKRNIIAMEQIFLVFKIIIFSHLKLFFLICQSKKYSYSIQFNTGSLWECKNEQKR